MIELVPPDYFAPLDLVGAFPRRAPLEVDVGCGEGAFVVEMARRYPERNFLGVERLRGRVRNTCEKATRTAPANTRVLRIDAGYFIRHLLHPASVAVFHIMFPDPWPKRRHRSRRLLAETALDDFHAALHPAGELRIVTDHPAYFAGIERLAGSHGGFEALPWAEEKSAPPSGFERRFQAEGRPIHRLHLRKL